MSADMYGLEAVKVVANSFIRREYCHMFHKVHVLGFFCV